MAELPEQGGTKGVDGGDLSPVDQGELAAEVPIVRPLRQALVEALENLTPEL